MANCISFLTYYDTVLVLIKLTYIKIFINYYYITIIYSFFYKIIKKVFKYLFSKKQKSYTNENEIINEFIPQDQIKNLIQEDLPFVKNENKEFTPN